MRKLAILAITLIACAAPRGVEAQMADLTVPGFDPSSTDVSFLDQVFDGAQTFEDAFASDLFALAEGEDFVRLVDNVVPVVPQPSSGGSNGQSANGRTAQQRYDDKYDSRTGGGTGMHEHHPATVHKTNKGQHPSSGGADPTDPTAVLTQIQLQNTFTFDTYNSSGYANTFVVQPVLPFPIAVPGLKEFAPFHIVRPTLPFPAPTADPDGPLGQQGGMGDLTILDVAIHPVSWGNIAFGYSLIAPTSTHPQLGLQEWQLGPTLGFIYKKVPKTVIGLVAQMPFSMESDAQQVDVQVVLVRHLKNEWYLRWGDTFNTFNTANGGYNIPIQPAIGKVVKKGLFGVPNNIFVAAEYTPRDLHSGTGGSHWGIKFNLTLLYPEKKLKPILGCVWGGKQCCNSSSCRCRR